MAILNLLGMTVEVLRKPDPDGFVLCRRVTDGAMRYIRASELKEEHKGELIAAIAKAPDWHAAENGYDREENLPDKP